jgi:hypothetical protein
MFAMLRSGIAPDSETITRLAAALETRCRVYGIPDTTWELAWLTAAFAELPEWRGGEMAKQLASKLLDGQQSAGPGRGLWGPLCVNTELLAAMIDFELALTKRLEELQTEERKREQEPEPRAHGARALPPLGGVRGIRRKPGTTKLSVLRTAEAAQQLLERFQRDFARVSTYGRRFRSVCSSWQVQPAMGERHATLPGLPIDIYRDSCVDLESTAIAVFALRQAKVAGLLTETYRPLLPGTDKPLIPVISSSAILARTAHALSTRQGKDGSFDPAAMAYGSTSFAELFDPAVKVAPPRLSEPATALSTAQGCWTLANIARIVGPERFARKFGPVLASAQARRAKGLGAQDTLPADFALALESSHLDAGGYIESDRKAWRDLAAAVSEGVFEANDGSLQPPSLAAWARTLPRVDYEIMRAVPGVNSSFWAQGEALELARQCYAMLFFARGARPPVAAVWQGSGRYLTPAIDALNRDKGITCTLANFATHESPAAVLYFRPPASKDDPAWARFVTHCESNICLLEIPSGSEGVARAREVPLAVSEVFEPGQIAQHGAVAEDDLATRIDDRVQGEFGLEAQLQQGIECGAGEVLVGHRQIWQEAERVLTLGTAEARDKHA